jgi:hypothetical protein
MSVIPGRNIKNEKFCSQFHAYFKRHVTYRSKRTCRLCFGQLERLKPRKKIELDVGARGLADCVEGSWRD